MFKQHRVWSQQLPTRNLVLLFLTIAFGFATVITLAQVTITPNIGTTSIVLEKLTIKADGNDTASRDIEFSASWAYISPAILQEKLNFTGRVLGITDNKVIAADEQQIIWNAGNMIWDNLGNHRAVKNLVMGMYDISNSGLSDHGISLNANNDLIVYQKIKTEQKIKISNDGSTEECSWTNAGEIRFLEGCFQVCDSLSWKNIVGSGCVVSG